MELTNRLIQIAKAISLSLGDRWSMTRTEALPLLPMDIFPAARLGR